MVGLTENITIVQVLVYSSRQCSWTRPMSVVAEGADGFRVFWTGNSETD
jgi:hypothetical protein